MDINSRLDFAASPERVYGMLTDQGYQEEVCRASQALSFDVSVSGSATRSRRTLPAPEAAARFTGAELTVVEEVTWNGAAPDGSRTGAMRVTVPGQPVTMNGTLQLTPGSRGTVVTLTADLKVNIPFLGRKLEQSAAPAVLAGFGTQQRVGDAWLTG